ncbi:MAG: hypothetical protein QXP94_03410 [Thermofilaceae archaeon]
MDRSKAYLTREGWFRAVIERVAEILARSLKLNFKLEGGYALLFDGAGRIQLYLFEREPLPRLGLFGYYAAHFIELWEGERLLEGYREVVEGDALMAAAARVLLGVGEPVVRVGRVRGKYGDPHVSKFFETRRFQIIREVVQVGTASIPPRIAPGDYAWDLPDEVCSGGVVGYLDGFWVTFTSGRIGFVRGLSVYRDCRMVAGRAEYESMGDLEEREISGLRLKKIPYRLAVSLLNASEAECCGFKVTEMYGPESWETPLWKKVYDRFEVVLRPLLFQRYEESCTDA